MERDRDGDIYHVMLDTRYLQDNRCQNIESINLVVVASSERVNYGQRGDDFNTEFLQKAGGRYTNLLTSLNIILGFAHCFKFPGKLKYLNGSITD